MICSTTSVSLATKSWRFTQSRQADALIAIAKEMKDGSLLAEALDAKP
jgi:hypothetical protein